MAMDIRQLRYFTRIAEAGSFLRAAQALGVSQPALTRQVTALETDIGSVLLARTVRGVQLTEAGARLLTHARTILAAVERARSELIEAKGTPQGSASVALSPAVSAQLVAPLVRQFRSLYPDVMLRIVEGFSGNIHEWLTSGRVDLGVLYYAAQRNSLVNEVLAEEDLFLVGPGRDPRWSAVKATVADLAQFPLILPSDPHGLRSIVEAAAAKRQIALRIVMEVDSVIAARELAQSGEGYAILPFGCIDREVKQRLLRATRVSNPRLAQPLVLASFAERPLSLAARELARLIRHHVLHLARSGAWPLRIASRQREEAVSEPPSEASGSATAPEAAPLRR
jgi:LysR family transcriptional regulator, nitrogen assimilation regulatory protein